MEQTTLAGMTERTYPASWAEEDKPIYKANAQGMGSLTNAELIAAIVGGNLDQSIAIAHQLLSRCNHTWAEIGRATVMDIMSMGIAGMTERTATVIKAAFEVGKRKSNEILKEKERITSSRDSYEILYSRMGDLSYEQFWVMTLNRANKVIGVHQISDGGLTGTIADPRRIFVTALQDKATGIVLCHNHPSGNVNPSSPDIELTKKIKESGKLLDIQIFDHIIIGGDRYYSFADEGML